MENTLLNITGSFDMETRNLISYSLTDIFETDKIRIELLGEIYYKNIGSIIFVVGKSTIDIMEPILL
ncbi:Uncharacterised protein [Streptococcus pneumoniae]|nr:Uncharacterised protein [Streptococcus pneumoniae]